MKLNKITKDKVYSTKYVIVLYYKFKNYVFVNFRIKKIMSTNGHGNCQNGRLSSTNDTMIGEFDDVELDHYDDIIEEESQMYFHH